MKSPIFGYDSVTNGKTRLAVDYPCGTWRPVGCGIWDGGAEKTPNGLSTAQHILGQATQDAHPGLDAQVCYSGCGKVAE